MGASDFHDDGGTPHWRARQKARDEADAKALSLRWAKRRAKARDAICALLALPFILGLFAYFLEIMTLMPSNMIGKTIAFILFSIPPFAIGAAMSRHGPIRSTYSDERR